ncbi:hypothetical protein [Magnetofaba australis]|uniref:hypothetical protein n=1 Tax=Magnetofaba australis TaxID=1472297 RepID=UPI000A19E77B|nr:hypothetical protein [Magnetofaba australis]
MSISALNAWTGGRASGGEQKVMAKIKQQSSVVPDTVRSRMYQGEGTAASYTKGYARKATSLAISGSQLSRGPFYPKPQ